MNFHLMVLLPKEKKKSSMISEFCSCHFIDVLCWKCSHHSNQKLLYLQIKIFSLNLSIALYLISFLSLIQRCCFKYFAQFLFWQAKVIFIGFQSQMILSICSLVSSAEKLKCSPLASTCNFQETGFADSSSLSDVNVCHKSYAPFKQSDKFCCQYQIQTVLPDLTQGDDLLVAIKSIDQVLQEVLDNQSSVGPDYLLEIMDKISVFDWNNFL